MPGDDAGSGDEVLAALVASLRAELAGSQAALARAAVELAAARERIAVLEARLGQTPRNSSRPPSSEGLGKPPPRRSLRKKSGRKPGGQDGHQGTTLAQVARPDRELRHEPGCCGRCGTGLASRPVTGVERRQVFDLPEITVTVTEHQLIERECRCGHRTKGAAPQGAQAPVQYGPRIAAIIVYLHAGQFLSKQRTAQALAELFAIPLSSGTVAGITARAAGRLDRFLERVREGIAAAEVAGFDETGFRVQGRLHWVHCARTGKYTLFMVHPRRGRLAMEAMGILPSFAGIAVHDAWAPYDTYASPDHQLCCAHALRELQAVTDAAPAGQWCWATQAAEALTAMQHLVREAIGKGHDAAGPAALAAQVRLFRSAALAGASQTAARSGALMKKHNALARRLLDRQDDYLRFTQDWRIPPDNNGCERDIRMTKLKQKVSGCLRTLTGGRQFCAIRSYLSTAAKHDLGSFNALVMLTEGQPWIPAAALSPANAAPDQLHFGNSSAHVWRGFNIVDNFVRLYSYVNSEYTNINGGVCLCRLSGFVIAGNVFMGGGMPVTLPDAVGGTVTGNHIEGWSEFAVELAGVTDGAPYKVAVTGNSLIDTDPRSPVHHSEAAIPVGGGPASYVTIADNVFEQVSPGGSPVVNIGVGAAMGTVHHITVTGNTLRKTGTGGGIVVNKSPDVTIADNILDFGGANNYAVWLATDNAATPVTLTGQVITGNQFLNYGAYSAILYGQSSGHPGFVDYAIFTNNVFRGGKSGITEQGSATLGPHTVRVNNVGP